jgi:hypothetical protein
MKVLPNGNIEITVQFLPEAYVALRNAMQRDDLNIADAVNLAVSTLDLVSQQATAAGKPLRDAMDRYTGNVTTWNQSDGNVRIEVVPGPLRVSDLLFGIAQRMKDGFMQVDGDVITFTGVDAEGAELVVKYRVTGEESGGPEGGWKLCEPIQN